MTANLIQPSPEGLHWYALKVFYNRVIYLRSLFPEDVETYTPMQTVEQYERGQLSYVEKQLIPSLLFVRCSEDWLVKFKHEHNADFMYYAEPESSRPGAIPDNEMRSFCASGFLTDRKTWSGVLNNGSKTRLLFFSNFLNTFSFFPQR